MKEEFLHYIWRFQKYQLKHLITSKEERLEIISVGQYNSHAGPDFLDARIKIGNTLWAGHVEIHINSSDWKLHNHSSDKAYDTVILHVVLNHDMEIQRTSGSIIQTLELKNRIFPNLESKYLKLQNNKYWISCQHHFQHVDDIIKRVWYDRLLFERLEQKATSINNLLIQNNNNWEKAFFVMLAISFGLKVNQLPFELMAKSIDLNVLLKHKDNIFQIEALIFGQAGMLNKPFSDKYPEMLKAEYLFLKNKYNMTPIKMESWKFLRLRPQNFPTIRLAQFSKLLFQESNLFSRVLTAKNIQEIENIFNIDINDYWNSHFMFDKASISLKKHLGRNTIHLIIVNTIAPFLFVYGKSKGMDVYMQKGVKLLEDVKSENNHVIKNWKALGENPKSAYDSQALLQLKNEYCNNKKCLNCAIGNSIMNYEL